MYALLSQPPGAQASGPAVIEGPFFTMRVPAGWQFATTVAGDLRLTDRGQQMSTVMRIPMTEYLEIDLGDRALAVPALRPRLRVRPRELQGRNAGL